VHESLKVVDGTAVLHRYCCEKTERRSTRAAKVGKVSGDEESAKIVEVSNAELQRDRICIKEISGGYE